MTLTCYAIDDESRSVKTITDYIEKTPHLELIGSHTNPLIAIAEIEQGQRPDIVFLDIEMPELSGIDVNDLLDPSISVVFTTAHSKYALQAFEKNAVDFLLKPFSFEMFLKSVNKVRGIRAIKKNNKPEPDCMQIFVNPGVKGKIVQIDLTEVTHIEAMDHSVCFHLPTERVVTNMSIKKIQEKIPTSKFIRVHRAYIVNINYIKIIDANEITLRNGMQIPFGEVYRHALMNKVQS